MRPAANRYSLFKRWGIVVGIHEAREREKQLAAVTMEGS